MTGIHFAIAMVARLLLVATIVGVVHRGYYRRCVTFIPYALAILTVESLITFWPSRFWNWPFWDFSQNAYAILKLGIAVEVAVRSLACFPGTWQMGGFINGAVLLLTTAAWLLAPAPRDDWGSTSHSVLSAGTIWLFAATILVAFWFRLPIHPWHRALLLGFTPYLLVFTTLAHVVSGQAEGSGGLTSCERSTNSRT